MKKRVRWMTETKSRCDHPENYRKLDFDLLDRPYYYCQKCDSDLSIEEVKFKDKETGQQILG